MLKTSIDRAAAGPPLPRVPAGVEVIPILDFGSQYAQLIARRVREAGAFGVLVAPTTPIEALASLSPRGIILSGGPASVWAEKSPTCDPRLLDLGVPILGICYGMQLGCRLLGAAVEPASKREYGRAKLTIADSSDLLTGLPSDTAVWMSHGDQVETLPEEFVVLARTPTCPNAVVRHRRLPFYGVQFHPEVTHTPHGVDLLRNFLSRSAVARARGAWPTSSSRRAARCASRWEAAA